MDERLTALLGGTHQGVLTTIKRDGRPQLSNVGYTYDPERAKHEPLGRFLRRISTAKFEPATGPATLCAVAVALSLAVRRPDVTAATTSR